MGCKRITRQVSRKIRHSGDADIGKRTIRVNPGKGDLLNTILHEEAHLKYPKMNETNIKKKAKAMERKLSPKRAIKLLKKYERNK